MYHKRPIDAQNAQPIPMPEGGRSERPEAGSRPPQGQGVELYIVRGHGLCKIPVLCHVHIIRFHFSEHHDLQKGPFADILSTCVQ